MYLNRYKTETLTYIKDAPDDILSSMDQLAPQIAVLQHDAGRCMFQSFLVCNKKSHINNENGYAHTTTFIKKQYENNIYNPYQLMAYTYNDYIHTTAYEKKEFIHNGMYIEYAIRYMIEQPYNIPASVVEALIIKGYGIFDCIDYMEKQPHYSLAFYLSNYLQSIDDTTYEKQYKHRIETLLYHYEQMLHQSIYERSYIELLTEIAYKDGLRQRFYNHENENIRACIAYHGFYLCYYEHDKSKGIRAIVASHSPYNKRLIFDNDIDVVRKAIDKDTAPNLLTRIQNEAHNSSSRFHETAIINIIPYLCDTDTTKLAYWLKQHNFLNNEYIKKALIQHASPDVLSNCFNVETETKEVRLWLARRGIHKKDIENEQEDIIVQLIISKQCDTIDNILDTLSNSKKYKYRQLAAIYHKHPYRLVKDKSVSVVKELAHRGYALCVLKKHKHPIIRRIVAGHPYYAEELQHDVVLQVAIAAKQTLDDRYINVPTNYYKTNHLPKITKAKRKKIPMVYRVTKGDD